MSGKGSRQRPTDKEKFNQGWDRIFGNKKNKQPIEENKKIV